MTVNQAQYDEIGWSYNQRQFMQWLAIPSDQRHPVNQRLLAKELGVNEVTLSKWKKVPGFLDEVNEMTRKQIDDALSDIYGALIREAKKGKHQHIKMVLEMAKHYTERREHVGDKDNPIVVEHDDKREKIKGAIDELAERRRSMAG